MLICYTTKSANLKTIFLVSIFNQRTPLHVAASNGRDYTVECLLKKTADMNIKDKTGVSETTPLMVV